MVLCLEIFNERFLDNEGDAGLSLLCISERLPAYSCFNFFMWGMKI